MPVVNGRREPVGEVAVPAKTLKSGSQYCLASVVACPAPF